MNFLQLLASGANILNFNFQSKASQSVDTFSKTLQKPQGFQKVNSNHIEHDALSVIPAQIPNDQTTILNQILQTERQELINRYLQLNIQLLEGKLSNQHHAVLSTSEEPQVAQAFDSSNKLGSNKKKIKKVTKCEHHDRAHYAKGLCNNCYHKYGRTKRPWNCPHDKLYAGGMCQNCYINDYNKKKRDEQKKYQKHDDQIAQQHSEAHYGPSNSEFPDQKLDEHNEQEQKQKV